MPKSVLFNEQVPRLYYSIGEVCQRFALSPSLLRFYESELGVPLHTKRTRNGKRLFTESNMELIETLVRLTRKEGVRTSYLKMHLQRMSLLPKQS
jgi:DNA-binding transcriptional MerR regulator